MLNNLYAEERKAKIIEIVEKQGSASVPELSGIFGVTGATIRSDLRDLENNDKLLRTHGGAVSLKKKGYELKPSSRTNDKLKRKIALKAVELISDGDTIVLDTGTTMLEVAKCILKSSLKDIKILTNDFKIVDVLENHASSEMIFIGGTVRKEFHYTIGYKAIQFLQQFSVDKVFLGTNALSFSNGLTTPDIFTAEFKECITNMGNEVFLVTDSSKFNKNTFVKFASLEKIDYLVTDAGIKKYELEELEKYNIVTYVVE